MTGATITRGCRSFFLSRDESAFILDNGTGCCVTSESTSTVDNVIEGEGGIRTKARVQSSPEPFAEKSCS